MSIETSPTDAFSAQDVVLLASTVDMSSIFYDGVAQELNSRHWKVHVVSSPGPAGERLLGQDARIHSLHMERGLSPLRDMWSLVRWVQLLAEVRPRVLVLGTPKASLLGGLAGRIMRTPHIVYVVHGLRGERTTGPLGKILEVVERLTLHSAHHVLAVSPSLRRAIEEAHPAFGRRIEVLGFGSMNGVDMTRFVPPSACRREYARQHWNLPKGSFVVGYVGRFHRDKGGKFLLDIMEDEATRRLDLHLLVVGDIEDEALQGRVTQLSAQGRMTVTGWVDDPESAMSGMDLLLHPTQREGLGMVLLEAQASGLPVVTNRVTGTIDAVRNGVGGYFAEMDSTRAWVDRIASLAADAEARRMTGRRGRAFVMERYDRNKVVIRFADYIADLSGPSRRSGQSGRAGAQGRGESKK